MPLYALFCKSQKIALHQGLIEQTKSSDPKFNKFILVDFVNVYCPRKALHPQPTVLNLDLMTPGKVYIKMDAGYGKRSAVQTSAPERPALVRVPAHHQVPAAHRLAHQADAAREQRGRGAQAPARRRDASARPTLAR